MTKFLILISLIGILAVGFILFKEKPKPTFTINAATNFSTQFPTCSDKGEYFIIRIPVCTRSAVSGLIHCGECHEKGEY